MSVRWRLVKFVQDIRRREPRNIGVIVDSDGAWAARFVGQDETGKVDGHKLRRYNLNRELLEAWIDYYDRKMSDDRWPDVERMQAVKTHTIYTEPGGYLFEHGSVQEVVDKLFNELVASEPPPAPESPIERLRSAVDQILERLEVVPDIEPTFEVQWDAAGHRSPVHFDYGHQNGRYHLMDRLSLSTNGSLVARDYWARAHAARTAGKAENFVAFYSNQTLGDVDDIDKILAPIEAHGPAINTDDLDEATEQLAEVFDHHK